MARIKYTNKAGKAVPGVTTVDDQLGWSKFPLMLWANKIGREGKTIKEASDPALDIGSCSHLMKQAHLKGQDPHLVEKDFSKETVDKAHNVFLIFLEWMDQHKVEPIAVEESMVSEELQVGGTPDLVAKIDGYISIEDTKSSNDLYPENWIQVAAYGLIWNELHPDRSIERYHINRFGKEKPEMEHHMRLDVSYEQEAFRLLRRLWDLKEKLK